MARPDDPDLAAFLKEVADHNPHEAEFLQAVEEVAATLVPFVREHEQYRSAGILERMVEPDRIIIFRVSWEDDAGKVQVNRAWRVQFNRAIGPYKGGLRFHPTVNQSVLKFLGFEQCFKNSLTGLPMGGAKGGSNFDPKGKSDREVMRFCQSLMTELYRHIGPDTDVPAGDIGVGSREIAYLYGQYLRLSNEFEGVLTGKGLAFGGSAVRAEATGYGCVYFLRHMLEQHGDGLEGKRVAISGSGNVAVFAAEKAIAGGGKVVTLSDSSGFVHDPEGIDEEKLEYVKKLKFERRGRLSEYAERFRGTEYHAGVRPWGAGCDVALPCATQNEIEEADARDLVSGGVRAVCEGANMPTTNGAVSVLKEADVLFAPGKAANAGGVAVSGLEQSQNAMRTSWSREEVDSRLQEIMRRIHDKCVEEALNGDRVDYVSGANIAGFRKIADAMLSYGVV